MFFWLVYQQIEDYLIHNDLTEYNKSSFLELNRNKVDVVHYLLGRDTRNRIAFAIGEKNGEWAAPFSAPFSSVIELRKNTTVEIFNTFFDHLVEYVKVHDGKSIDLYPPANIYGEHMNAKVMNALLGNGFAVEYADINYSFELGNINLNTYESMLHYNGKWLLFADADDYMLKGWYDIIQKYLRMSRESHVPYICLSDICRPFCKCKKIIIKMMHDRNLI